MSRDDRLLMMLSKMNNEQLADFMDSLAFRLTRTRKRRPALPTALNRNAQRRLEQLRSKEQ